MDEKDYTEDVEDAKAEYLTQIQGIITGLRDNMTVIIAGKEYNNTHVIPDNAKAEDYGFVETTGSRQVERDETIGWNVDVEYKSDFTKKIRVDETYSWEIIRSIWSKGVDWKANEVVKEKVNSFKNNLSSEYTYDGSSDTVDGEWHLLSSGTIEGDIFINYHRTNNATKSIAVYNADKEAAKAAAKLDASVTGTANIGNGVTETKSVVNATVGTAITKKVYPIVTTYGYASLDYILKTVTTQQNQVTYTESWAVEEETSHKEYRNDNWYSGDVISIKVDKNNNNAFVADYKTDGKSQNGNKAATVKDTAKSEALVNKINEAKNKIGQYDAAIAAVKTAEDKVKAAEGEVETLKGLIEQISFSKKDNILAGLRSRLETAETELATAKAARDQLLEDLRTLDGQRAQKVAALTSTPSGEGGGETGGEDGATTPGATGLLPGTAAPLAAGPAMFVAAPGGAGAPAAAVAEDNTVTLTEQRTALSDAAPEAQTEQTTENIDDGKTALAAAPVSEETLSWWWLLIIAVLGGAGYAMYRKFHNKKDEKTTN
jgi:hypothetical protein